VEKPIAITSDVAVADTCSALLNFMLGVTVECRG